MNQMFSFTPSFTRTLQLLPVGYRSYCFGSCTIINGLCNNNSNRNSSYSTCTATIATTFRRQQSSSFLMTNTSMSNQTYSRRLLSFSFAGPRRLDDLLKKETIQEKPSSEVADIWYTYHENKDNVVGLVLDGDCGKKILSRAKESPFFVNPVFRDEGYFMLVSQFQSPSHFLCAYLEDYKMDPVAATPLLTFSIFDDYAIDKNITLIRCDVLNNGIDQQEGRTIVQNLLNNYKNEVTYYSNVHAFNKHPDKFDFESYVEQMKVEWQKSNNKDNNNTNNKEISNN